MSEYPKMLRQMPGDRHAESLENGREEAPGRCFQGFPVGNLVEVLVTEILKMEQIQKATR